MKITLSKSQWENIGKKTGWIKVAMDSPELDISQIPPDIQEDMKRKVSVFISEIKRLILTDPNDIHVIEELCSKMWWDIVGTSVTPSSKLYAEIILENREFMSIFKSGMESGGGCFGSIDSFIRSLKRLKRYKIK